MYFNNRWYKAIISRLSLFDNPVSRASIWNSCGTEKNIKLYSNSVKCKICKMTYNISEFSVEKAEILSLPRGPISIGLFSLVESES